jgi:O-6-methylguanine DNA methyltransferase
MDEFEKVLTIEAPDLVQGLRGLGDVKAPRTLLAGVMARTGLGDAYWRVQTPIGPVFVAYNDHGISALMRASDAAEFERAFRLRFDRPLYPTSQPPADLGREVARQLAGGRGKLRFDLSGLTDFERAVLLKALEIPYGQVRPYAWIAREIGRPKAVRAVGTALGNNPIPLLIPCHRVVRRDGRIGDYALGSDTKRAILRAEGVAPEDLETLARSGVRYYGSDTTHVFCFPTCTHARRITDRHRVAFHSEADALGAGYRPCKVCRPVA